MIRKNLLTRHGQGSEQVKKDEANVLGKRMGDQLDRYDGGRFLKPENDLGYQSKRAKMGEKFDQFDDFFALE